MRTNSSRNGPSSIGAPSGSISRRSVDALEAVLVELRADHAERQPRRPHLADPHFAQQIRQRADVILVAVREHDGADLAVVEVAEVGQDEVDAEVLVAREREPCVDDERSRRRSRTRSCSCRPRRGRRAGSPQNRVRHPRKHTATSPLLFHRLWRVPTACGQITLSGWRDRRQQRDFLHADRTNGCAAAGPGDASALPATDVDSRGVPHRRRLRRRRAVRGARGSRGSARALRPSAARAAAGSRRRRGRAG